MTLIFLENCDIDDSLFWERMKYLEENKVIYNKSTKNGNSFYISKRDRATISSPTDKTPVINSPTYSVSTPQDLQHNLSLISNGIDTLDKFMDATLFNLTQKSTTEKKSDKQQQTQNIKDPILETLQDTISILRTELVHKQKTIDTLMLIIEKITTGPSNVQARLTPFEEREEPEEQHQHEFQFHQEDLTRHQHLDTRQDEMQQQQHVNQEHSQHKQQQHQTQEQQLQQLHQQVQQQQELQKLQQ